VFRQRFRRAVKGWLTPDPPAPWGWPSMPPLSHHVWILMTYYLLCGMILARAGSSVTLIPLNALLIISSSLTTSLNGAAYHIQCTSCASAMTAAGRAGGAGPAPQIPDGTCHRGRWGTTNPHGELPDARGLRCADHLRVHRGVQHPDLVRDHVRLRGRP